MKQLLPLLLTLLLLTACTSAAIAPSGEEHIPDAALQAEYRDRRAYNTLSADQQLNYSAVYEAVYHSLSAESTVTVSGSTRPEPGVSIPLPCSLADEADTRALYEAFVRDNPQFFFLTNVYGFEGRQAGNKKEFATLKLVYYLSATERIAAAQRLETVCRQLLAALPEGDAFERELFLHDELLSRCVYDDEAASSDAPTATHPAAFSAYGALVEGRAVCEGYSRAMQYLLQQAGIPAAVVTGLDAGQTPHMWNLVTVNGSDYHLDATWNDTAPHPHHAYFNLSDEQLPHMPDADNPGLSPCTATADSYYTRTDSILSTYRYEDIARRTAQRLADGAAVIEWQFSLRETYDNALFFLRNAAWFRDTVNACLPAGAAPLGDYTFFAEDDRMAVLLCKKQS